MFADSKKKAVPVFINRATWNNIKLEDTCTVISIKYGRMELNLKGE